MTYSVHSETVIW